jgi:hypothetical protein
MCLPNLTTLTRGGFVHASKRQQYQGPSLKSFANAEEVWDYFKDKGTPEERARLREMLRLMPAGDETKEAPLRRRA